MSEVFRTKKPQRRPLTGFKLWLFGEKPVRPEGPHEPEESQEHHQHSWWKVMCLTGVDYFSTLGYQPGIAFLAAGILSPIATFILVLLSLFAALPVYSKVAEESPHGEGSISMLEALLPRWKGKLFVLVLLGFVATDFIITITLSAADATAHIIENPFAKDIGFLHHPVIITLALVLFLGLVFLKGFKEAIGLAIVLVALYLGINAVVILTGIYHIIIHPSAFSNWTSSLFTAHGNPFLMVGLALLLFPKLALGLSGFETGVAVMPLVDGGASNPANIEGRVTNTKKLLKTAALIMSVALLTSSIVTTTLIPAHEFAKGGEANGRALAYLAHEYLGDVFGTFYDISTIMILWFAGSSAMAGLLNIVPRYLPRYGMAPEWASAIRPLVLVFTGIAFLVTIIFQADVDAQAGAYATGVLVLMTSAAVAVTLSQSRKGKSSKWGYMIISFAFAYTTVVNIIERPEGLQIALIFVAAIVFFSLISRVMRSTELRVKTIEVDDKAEELIARIAAHGPIRIIANRKDKGDAAEYAWKEKMKREDNHIPKTDDILFFEVSVADASTFAGVLKVRGVEIDGFKILRAESSAVPNAIAAFMLYLRDKTGKIPHIYFGWTEGNPISHMMKFVAFGEGDTAPVTREVLRQAEPEADNRPSVHVGG
jgi:hypothetical protein